MVNICSIPPGFPRGLKHQLCFLYRFKILFRLQVNRKRFTEFRFRFGYFNDHTAKAG
uniref:Uncharacterized protein n=1 Tax=Anguilla anguilla TaxID=7936 RepID=A0A0E9U9M3_ANGAN